MKFFYCIPCYCIKPIKTRKEVGTMKSKIVNPIPELIPDEIYIRLKEHNIIDEKAVRDYLIRKKFRELRQQKVSAGDAIDNIREEYPYLQFDTIRKIVYQINKNNFS
jgi:hypothetical protein